jgi:predicted nuclease of predicted toxin-antitoxin system
VKVKLDENIPVSLIEALTLLGHDVQTVIGQGLTGRTDREIWTQCQLEDRLLITQDLDFSDSRKFQPGSHAGIVLVRLQNPGRVALFNSLISIFRNHDVQAWKGALSSFQKQKFELGATKSSLRVRPAEFR